jgi:hypothetical protein
MAIAADEQINTEWHDMWQQNEGGTTFYQYYVFIERILQWLTQYRPNSSYCFTSDNLNVHHDQRILDLIERHGHKYLFRAPYWILGYRWSHGVCI